MSVFNRPPSFAGDHPPVAASPLARLARKLVLSKLDRLAQGRLEVMEGGQMHVFGQCSGDFPVPVRLQVLDPDFYADVAFGGTVGAGEAYILGLWRCDDLTGLIRLMARNREAMEALEGGAGSLLKPVNKAFHWWHRNSVKGSRRNIAAHYDLGNDFFALFLDPTLSYSCGIFERPDATLEEASVAKLDRICRKLALEPDDHVLEIGTGWGGFAIHAAGRYGCRVTTTTISGAQYRLAAERIRQAGLEDRITLLQKDFRELEGTYDKLVSVEMIEAVGEANISRFFQVCDQRLRPDGKMLLQGITIADSFYDNYRKSVDFIQRYVFPGGFLPSVSSLCQAVKRHTGMRLFHLEDIGPHYVDTLRHWRQNFMTNLDAVRALGYPPEFIRLWEFYLCYCEGGFAERTTGNMQMVLVKEEDRSPALIGV